MSNLCKCVFESLLAAKFSFAVLTPTGKEMGLLQLQHWGACAAHSEQQAPMKPLGLPSCSVQGHPCRGAPGSPITWFSVLFGPAEPQNWGGGLQPLFLPPLHWVGSVQPEERSWPPPCKSASKPIMKLVQQATHAYGLFH